MTHVSRAGTKVLLLCGLALILLGGSMGCSRTTTSNQGDASPMKPIEEVLNARKDSLMAVKGVKGVGQGRCDDNPCIRIYAAKMTDEVKALPDSIDGYALDVEVTGTFGPRSGQ